MFHYHRLIVCLVILLAILLLTRRADSSCSLSTSGNRPILVANFGSKHIIITKQIGINLDEGANGFAYCASGFKKFIYSSSYEPHLNYESRQLVHFYCLSNEINLRRSPAKDALRPYLYNWNPAVHNHDDDDFDVDYPSPPREDRRTIEGPFECSGTAYAVFESAHQLPHCADFQSYALGAKLSTPIIIAALCYDLDSLTIRHVSYKLQEPSVVLEKAAELYPLGLHNSSLSEPLKSIEHILDFPSSSDINRSISNSAENNFWLRIADFELDSIVQTSVYYDSAFKENANYFNIVWWKNLRIGNWRRFIQLLEARSESVVYNVYTGVAGQLRLPVELKSKCEPETSKTLEVSDSYENGVLFYRCHPIQFADFKTTVPQFIWTYLNSTHEDIPEDFVVIAYNSPYFENFNQNSTLLCKDMCDEIEWLKPMEDSRRISALGRLYCCHLEDVVGRLDGFSK